MEQVKGDDDSYHAEELSVVLPLPKMEAVDAAASISGILSLTIQGIQATDTLRNFCKHCTHEAAQVFMRELVESARILTEVRYLCDRINQINSQFRNEIRLASLQV
jgi:hypothetical protein